MKRKRSKFPDPSQWNWNKQKKTVRQAHINTVSKKLSARLVKEKDCSRCPKRCGNNYFTYKDRILLNEKYWTLGINDLQKQYIRNLIEQEKKII